MQNVTKDKVKVSHILKADPFGQKIKVLDTNSRSRGRYIVEDTVDFFSNVYASSTEQLVINNQETNYSIDEWIKKDEFINPENTMLYIIEGYAGCGKSTLVQHILYEVFEKENYEYSYYNYDIGGFETGINSDSNYQINASIIEGLAEQIISILSESLGEEIYKCFKQLTGMREVEIIDKGKYIWENFTMTKTVNDAIEKWLNCSERQVEECRKELLYIIKTQIKDFETYYLLCIDYIWRLAQYLTNYSIYKKCMYVCYDNLDSIVDISSICSFNHNLIRFRSNLNAYVMKLSDKLDIEINPFMIFVTYRKITATRTLFSDETLKDLLNNSEFVVSIDVSKQYDFSNIVKSRIRYFRNKINSSNLLGNRAKFLEQQMERLEQLIETEFIKEKYVSLLNSNYRACSNVIDEVLSTYEHEVKVCIDVFGENFDGDYEVKHCYYGASSIILHLICKLLKSKGVWDSQHLDLENFNSELIPLSPLILFLVENGKEESVSITVFQDTFDKIYGESGVCRIIEQMLKRVGGEVWRRPLYYSVNAIYNEESVWQTLMEQCRLHIKGAEYSYTEFQICDCGKTFTDKVLVHFESYSVRADGNNKPLCIIEDVEQLNNTMWMVYQQVKNSCEKHKKFKDRYMKEYHIKKTEDFLKCKFHPRTRHGRTQLFMERVIFSHIAYFNSCRLHLVHKYEQDEFNTSFLNYISLYIQLYYDYIYVIDPKRQYIAEVLKEKYELAKKNKFISVEYNSN